MRGLALALCMACAPAAERSSPRGGDGTEVSSVGGTTSVVDLGQTRAVHDADFLPAALELNGAARDEVRVAQFLLTDDAPADEVIAALVSAALRGVHVRVLADEEGEDTLRLLDHLASAGVEGRLDDPEVMLHNKLIVADEAVVVGSHNLTGTALSTNHEGSVLVVDAEVASWYAAWFDALWDTPAVDPTPLSWTRTDLVPVADRAITTALLDCIESAQTDVALVMYALSWDARYPGSDVDRLLLALEGVLERGIPVQVTLDDSWWIRTYTINDAAVERLVAAGADVALTRPQRTTHAKVLRCDDTVVVSDANWTYSGLELVHGTSLVARNVDVVAVTRAWMDDVRAAASPP